MQLLNRGQPFWLSTFSQFLNQHPNPNPQSDFAKTPHVTPLPLALLLKHRAVQEAKAKFGWIADVANDWGGTGLGHTVRSLMDQCLSLGHHGVPPAWGRLVVQIWCREQRRFIWGWQGLAQTLEPVLDLSSGSDLDLSSRSLQFILCLILASH